jgi:hypothetical protein
MSVQEYASSGPHPGALNRLVLPDHDAERQPVDTPLGGRRAAATEQHSPEY